MIDNIYMYDKHRLVNRVILAVANIETTRSSCFCFYLCSIILVTGITDRHTITETDTILCFPDPETVLPMKDPTPTLHYVHTFIAKLYKITIPYDTG